jgi:hypothetical protein
MIGMLIAGRTAERLPADTTRGDRDDLLRLMLLREIGDRGPVTGADVMAAIASLVCSFDLASPGFALLHDLRDAALLEASCERPPRYAVTPEGRREDERLAAACWPGLRAALVELNVCVGCLAPRDPALIAPAVGAAEIPRGPWPATVFGPSSRTTRRGSAAYRTVTVIGSPGPPNSTR